MVSKLLLTGDYPLIASPTLAKAYGLAAATFLQKLHYCLQSTDAKTHKGKKYWFHTYTQWVETLGLFSISTIKRIVARLKEEGILMVQKLSQSKWLQTNYYTINYKKLKELFTPQAEEIIQDNPPNFPQPSQPSAPKPGFKIAPEAKPKPSIHYPKQTIHGSDRPLNTRIPELLISQLSEPVFSIYKALWNAKVDISHDDLRLAQWAKYQSHILKYIGAFRESCGGIERYKWHTPEQLGLDRFTI